MICEKCGTENAEGTEVCSGCGESLTNGVIVFKCKMCGGSLDVKPRMRVVTCKYCESTQTLPKMENEKAVNLFDRANHFRSNNEYDKAMSIYESILNVDSTDAEVYWSLVLCRYGIQYVEDPKTKRRVPTVNRMQYTSVYNDINYKSAIENADQEQVKIYEAEAKTINEIQKRIALISQNEDPFDVFICYKETDADGKRTQDSVIANDLYHQLVQENLRVFFARITLEDKLGQEYEPYIFSALNSAKVMVVIGTKPEHFNAVWVKNEWSRYLSLIKEEGQGGRRVLVPAYRDMDPYDLPEEFSHLQAQDMSKLGFMQDLIRGIKKIVNKAPDKPVTVVSGAAGESKAAKIDTLQKRLKISLQDGEFSRVTDFSEQILNLDPENELAYLGKLLANRQIRDKKDLINCKDPLEGDNNFKNIMRFGSNALKQEMDAINKQIKDRNIMQWVESSYQNALRSQKLAKKPYEYLAAAEEFKKIEKYKDSKDRAEACVKKSKTVKKVKAIVWLSVIAGIILVIFLIILNNTTIKPAKQYKTAVECFDKGNYERAIEEFGKVTGYKDADTYVVDSKYMLAEQYMALGRYDEASSLYSELGDYKDCADKSDEARYCSAEAELAAGAYELAMNSYSSLIDYKDSVDKRNSIKALSQKDIVEGKIVYIGNYEQDVKAENGNDPIAWKVVKVEDGKALLSCVKCLDILPYNSEGAASWSSSSLRAYLNDFFYNNAFTAEEQAKIKESTVTTDSLESSEKVFILSVNEINEFYPAYEDKCATASNLVYEQGLNGDNLNVCYWIRSNGNSEDSADYITETGEWSEIEVASTGIAVRPAIWITLEE